jgi:hypothetical protein
MIILDTHVVSEPLKPRTNPMSYLGSIGGARTIFLRRP